MTFIIDIRTGKLTNDIHSGVSGFVSWRRLTNEIFRQSKEISDKEVIVVLACDERGIIFIVEEKK